MVNFSAMRALLILLAALAALPAQAQQRREPTWQPAPMPLAQPTPIEGGPKRTIPVRPRQADANRTLAPQPPRPPKPVAGPERRARPQPVAPVPPRPVDPATATTVTTTLGPDGTPQQTVARGVPLQPPQGSAAATPARPLPLPPGTPPVTVRRAPPPGVPASGALPATAPNGADIARQMLMQGMGLNALTGVTQPLPRP